jgi:predicted dehydrogenase
MNATERALRIASRASVSAIRIVAGLPDSVLRSLASAAESLARLSGASPETERAVRDLAGLAKEDSEGLSALREILVSTPVDELSALIAGAVRHHGLPVWLDDPDTASRRLPGPPPRVAILGDGLDASLAVEAYEHCRACTRVERVSDGVDAVEAAGRIPDGLCVLLRLLEGGTAVSVHSGCLEDSGDFDQLLAASRKTGTPLRLFHAPLFWPPVRRLLRVVSQGRIGPVSSIRVQAILGGHGGRLDPSPPERTGWLRHPAFDHGLLLAALGGPITGARTYLNPMVPGRGGQGAVACAFETPARFGVLECVWAPGMRVESDLYPFDLQVEVAGSDGVVWLRRGMGRRTHEAAIRVRTGRTEETSGAATGLVEDWRAAYALAADWMPALVRGHHGRELDDAAIRSGLRLREARNTAG